MRTLFAIWIVAAVLSVLGYFFCRWCKSAAALAVVCGIFWAYGMISEVQDPHGGSALGRGYVAQGYAAGLVPLAIMGGAFWIRSRKNDAA